MSNGNNTKKEEDICELEHLRKLFIGGLAPVTNEDSLRSFYSQWGTIVDCVVMRDPQTKRSRGFGFITYSRAYMVDKAQDCRPHIIDSKEVEAKRALPRPELGKPESNVSVRKIFVGGLKENHDEQCLTEYFSQFGNVVSVKIIHDKITGRKRGFGYIEFDDYDSVDKAVLQKSHSIKYVLVDVKKSVYKQELQKRQAEQGSQMAAGVPQAAAAPYPTNPANGWAGQNYNYGPPPTNWGYPQNGQQNWSAPPPPPQQYQGGWGQPYPPPASNPQVNYGAADPNAAAAQQQQNWGNAGFGGNYQQSYNGGPAKTSHLQANRMAPYSGPPANGYGQQPAPAQSGYGAPPAAAPQYPAPASGPPAVRASGTAPGSRRY